MKHESAIINSYGRLHAGKKIPAQNFYVFQNDDAVLRNEKLYNHPLRFDHFMMILVLEGESKIQVNLVDFLLKKNSFIVIPPNVVHQLSESNGNIRSIHIGFSTEFLTLANFDRKFVHDFDFFCSQSNPYLFLNHKEAEILIILLSELRKRDLSDEEHSFQKEIIYHIFNAFMFEVASIFKCHRPFKTSTFSRKEKILTSFLSLLSKHFEHERSVQFYADALFITANYLSKTVKEITNKTCGEMIDEMVIVEAKILLKNDISLSVANVADKLNFSNQFFFSKFFKKHTGINPSKYQGKVG